MKEVIVNKNDAGQRLDKFLSKYTQNMPQAMLYKSIRKNCVKLNGKHIKDVGYMLKAGDILNLYFKDEFFPDHAASEPFMSIKPNIDIVYEDENIILVNKPAGVNVHADDSGDTNTLIEHLKAYLWQKGEYNPQEEQSFTPALCNRIDRNTQGIVIAAKNAESLRIMNEKIKNREIEKFYLLIASGILPKKSGRLSGYIFKDEKKKIVYVSNTPKKGAKTAVTDYRVIAEANGNSLVEAKLLTGRTHQIRAHFASIGHPLLGDGKYGSNKINRGSGFSHQALCSYRLIFRFTTDAGILSYLNNREFKLEDVDFLQQFQKTGL